MRYFIIIFLLIATAHAQINPKSVEEMTAVIHQGGTLSVTGYIEKANLSLHIPQEGIESIAVSGADSWDYVNDKFSNKLLLLTWKNPSGTINYDVKITVNSKSKHFLSLGDIGTDPQYTKETDTIIFNDDIRKTAFPYEKTWERVAELTVAVNELVDYDINLVGERKGSDWVLQNRRGVCVEHANLLTALLRVSDIPTRYVVGYAYSTVDDKLIGHTWVEVLSSSGEWIPFDPTWLEGSYIDATHIKTANLMDDNQLDLLNYFGSGRIEWQRTQENIEIATKNLTRDKIDIISYKLANVTQIIPESDEFASNAYGFVKARIESNECSIVDLRATSCIDEDGQYVFDVYDSNRTIWLCGSDDVYWFFDINDAGYFSYSCPVTIYDQIGSLESIEINVSGIRSTEKIAISGPDTVAINEKFSLSGDGVIYSPDFGVIEDDLTITKPGKYRFYLYSEGALELKDVDVVETTQFSVRVSAPNNATVNNSFLVNVRVKNHGRNSAAIVKLHFDDRTEQISRSFLADEEQNFVFNLTGRSEGTKKITAEIISDSLASYTTFVDVNEMKKNESFVDTIISAITNVITSFLGLFSGIFKPS